MAEGFEKRISTRAADDLPELRYQEVPGEVVSKPHRLERRVGPMRIFAAVPDRPLGENIIKNLYLAAVTCQFDEAYTTVYYPNDRPYKRDVLALNPFLYGRLQAAPNGTLPIEFFYGFGDRARFPGADAFIKKGHAFPDLLITPSMVQPTDPLRFEFLPHLGIPVDRQAELDQRLVDAGIDPNRWFCCLYYREPGYAYRPAVARRDVSPEPFMELTRWIIRELGGQVVRIGHPEMTPFPKTEGYIDLIGEDIPFLLQAAAVARCRFGVLTNSGPACLFGAFGIPNVMANAISINLVWRDNAFALPRHFVGPEGERFDVQAAIREGWWNENSIENMMRDGGFTSLDNTVEELSAAARQLYAETADTSGWRPHRDVLAEAAGYTDRPNTHVTNGPFKRTVRVVEYPEFAPRG